MFPALPTGMQWNAGARPRASQISNAAVFWPSMRSGFRELTSAIGWVREISTTSRSAASKLPRIAITRAPCISACESFPRAIFP